MTENKPTPLDVELDALQRRSAELIAGLCRINERINELKAKQPPSEPGIADTWVEPKPRD